MSKTINFDIGKNEPPKQERAVFEGHKYSCFGYSLQGASHVDMNVPCQDFNAFKYIEGADVIVAAIADGVGSCPLSHWGSYTAVNAAVDYTEQEIRKLSRGKKLTLTACPEMPAILAGAFLSAANLVEDLAEQQNRPISAFMSTLTLVVYDGANLYCQHVGDDGVVAQFKDGSVEMVTQRIKGEEASSVYPLQSGKKFWQLSKAGADERGPVVAFVMATDGVLDAFVMGNDAYASVKGCCGGVYYPFMERSVYAEDNQHKVSPRKAEEALSYYLDRMKSRGYREQVTDDLTLLSIINPMAVKRSTRPFFDKKAFDDVTREIKRRQDLMLYSRKRPEFEDDRPPGAGVSVYQEAYHKADGRNDKNAKGYKHEEDADNMEFIDDLKIVACSLGILVIGIIFGFLLGIFVSGRKEAPDPADQMQPPAVTDNSTDQKKPSDDKIGEEGKIETPPRGGNTKTEEPSLPDYVRPPLVTDSSADQEKLADDAMEEEGKIEAPYQGKNTETEDPSLSDNAQPQLVTDNSADQENPADNAMEEEGKIEAPPREGYGNGRPPLSIA